MNDWPTIVGAWAVGVFVIGGYAVMLVRRGRRLSRRLPAASQRWIRS